MKLPLYAWQVLPITESPQWLIDRAGLYAAQLIWQRGWRSPLEVESLLSPDAYIPSSSKAFGQEMEQAVARIQTAFELGEKVAIWGDFDADGITATAVLWEGLGQFFPKDKQLIYYIPNRLKESHGLSRSGIDTLLDCQLIITCDTGSTNSEEIRYARSHNLDVIVTDHHTLPAERPDVTAIINPRYLEQSHPLYHLSGVAVAFKLMEALYEAMPNVPTKPLEDLLDLVAIGLVADLVQLVGDCRYLAQKGIEVLKQKKRPGIKLLLEQCKKSGDRPTDISFGIAPRINSVSRIWGDVRKCVELLTSEDPKVCADLANLAEMANAQRKALQKKIFTQVQAKVAQVDLSTAAVLVLEDPNWPVGILGLVAGQAASEYGRPVILCNVEDGVARCSARSPAGIDFYELIKGQEHLLTQFGGHPLAAGLSLPSRNLGLFKEAIDQKYWNQYHELKSRDLTVDLVVLINELVDEAGQNLFRQIKQLEPFGMGLLTPKLLIRNCKFIDKRHANIKNIKNQKIEYIRSSFTLTDATGEIHGDWWGHYEYEIPDEWCDVVVELVDNPFTERYEVRLIDIQPLVIQNHAIACDDLEDKFNRVENYTHFSSLANSPLLNEQIRIFDYRGQSTSVPENVSTWQKCPSSWQEIHDLIETSKMQQTLALTYSIPAQIDAVETWQTLVGIAKYLGRTQKKISLTQLQQKINIYDIAIIHLGLDALANYGWKTVLKDDGSLQIFEHQDYCQTSSLTLSSTQITQGHMIEPSTNKPLQMFLSAVNELAFRQKYFDRQTFQTLSSFLFTTK